MYAPHDVRCVAVRACLFLIATIAASSIAFSRPVPLPIDTLRHNSEVVLYIGCINFDCYRDTVIGWMDEKFHYLPHSIHWGQSSADRQQDERNGGDDRCSDALPLNTRRLDITTITYPPWDSLSGSVSFQHVNADTLTDLVLYVWGRVGDPLHRSDIIQPLLIFGQHGMDTLQTLDLGKVNGFQSSPFFAMQLQVGTDFVKPEVRDLSGTISYIRQPVSYQIDSVKTPSRDTGAAHPVHVRVYPNPTTATAQVESESTPPGEYSVEVVAVNGEMMSRQNVTVTSSRGLFKTLSLSDVPSGYYLIRIHSAAKLIGSYPITITR